MVMLFVCLVGSPWATKASIWPPVGASSKQPLTTRHRSLMAVSKTSHPNTTVEVANCLDGILLTVVSVVACMINMGWIGCACLLFSVVGRPSYFFHVIVCCALFPLDPSPLIPFPSMQSIRAIWNLRVATSWAFLLSLLFYQHRPKT